MRARKYSRSDRVGYVIRTFPFVFYWGALGDPLVEAPLSGGPGQFDRGCQKNLPSL